MSSLGKPIAASLFAAVLLVAASGVTMAGPRCGSNSGTTSTSTADSGGETAAPSSGANTGG